MSLGLRQNKGEPVLIFNIGSSNVSGALVLANNTEVPRIIFSAAEPIALEEKMDTDRFLSRTLKSLELVAGKIHQAGLGAPRQVFCVLSSPWYISQTRTINLKKNSPFIFSEKIADDLIKREIKLFSEEHTANYPEVQNAIRTIELKNLKTTLNGYETLDPLNKKAKELEMVMFISMSGEMILRKMEDAISKFFHFDRIKFSSFAMASFTLARDIHPRRENFLLVDIGGEITEIFMAKKNVLRDSISFPSGSNFFSRSVAAAFGSTLGEANSLISLWKDGHAEETVAAKLNLIMDKLKGEWLRKFQESLANISNDISIPPVIYITSAANFTDLFSAIIKAEQFSQYSLAESKFEIIILNTKLLHGLAVFEEEASRDIFLIIDSVYINRFLVKI